MKRLFFFERAGNLTMPRFTDYEWCESYAAGLCMLVLSSILETYTYRKAISLSFSGGFHGETDRWRLVAVEVYIFQDLRLQEPSMISHHS